MDAFRIGYSRTPVVSPKAPLLCKPSGLAWALDGFQCDSHGPRHHILTQLCSQIEISIRMSLFIEDENLSPKHCLPNFPSYLINQNGIQAFS